MSAPQHVAILGLGPSVAQFYELIRGLGGRRKYCDAIWAINALGDLVRCDMVFHMDDVRIQEIRAAARPDSNIAAMVEWLKTSPVPVMTSRLHPDYPSLREFPLQAVLNDLGFDYFNSTAAYAVAYAIHTGVKKISLWGFDYTYPDAHDAEKGRACVEFWLGMAAARGIQIAMPKTTTLMDAIYSRQERLYGYDTRTVTLTGERGAVTVEFEEIPEAEYPVADQIEAAYDHSKHPNALVSGEGAAS